MKKIILVESQPEQINIYRHVFEKTDFDVELAAQKTKCWKNCAISALGILKKPDLVLLDFMLADGHGIEVLKAIKNNSLPGISRCSRYELPKSATLNCQIGNRGSCRKNISSRPTIRRRIGGHHEHYLEAAKAEAITLS